MSYMNTKILIINKVSVLNNYHGCFNGQMEENIEKTRKKAGMIFSSDFDRRKPLP